MRVAVVRSVVSGVPAPLPGCRGRSARIRSGWGSRTRRKASGCPPTSAHLRIGAANSRRQRRGDLLLALIRQVQQPQLPVLILVGDPLAVGEGTPSQRSTLPARGELLARPRAVGRGLPELHLARFAGKQQHVSASRKRASRKRPGLRSSMFTKRPFFTGATKTRPARGERHAGPRPEKRRAEVAYSIGLLTQCSRRWSKSEKAGWECPVRAGSDIVHPQVRAHLVSDAAFGKRRVFHVEAGRAACAASGPFRFRPWTTGSWRTSPIAEKVHPAVPPHGVLASCPRSYRSAEWLPARGVLPQVLRRSA